MKSSASPSLKGPGQLCSASLVEDIELQEVLVAQTLALETSCLDLHQWN
ncbi:hypothetical protein E2C01_091622 [Portunus trituberculatus]|uniref:Uncharacterized protein n=1 Tax=Portunus trituberculatus TaxID=210409 RepID=A0A5B7JP35_PORTR|nr:hypothetical protein [Portunus trituberculatus]